MLSSARLAPLVLCALAAGLPLAAKGGTVEALFFDDQDADGLWDAGEPPIAGLPVTLWRGADVRLQASSDTAGRLELATQDLPHALEVALPPGWRFALPDPEECPAEDDFTVGTLRLSSAIQLRGNTEDAGEFLYISLGDSIAAGANLCFVDTNYVEDVAVDLEAIHRRDPSTWRLENRAIGGWHSEDLLTPIDEFGRPHEQFVGNVVAAVPDLVTISIGGNDFLSSDPPESRRSEPFDPADVAASIRELIHTRQTAQEILSVLASELPATDLEINTVYDPESHACSTNDFYARSVPSWNRMLRDLALGQVRPVSVAEVYHDFAHRRPDGDCCGPQGLICQDVFDLDGIHPNAEGALVIEQAVMESLGQVRPEPGVVTSVSRGMLREVARLQPAVVDALGGRIQDPDAALALDDAGAAVAPEGGEPGWLELSGFALPPDVQPSTLVVGVRYRTTGAFVDDVHRFEASVLGFAAPELTFEGWDTVTPLVGGSGLPGGGIGGPSVVNALPDVPSWRVVSAKVTLPGGALPTPQDVQALRVRLTVSVDPDDPGDTPDGPSVEWDGAWLEVYGTSAAPDRPGEVSDVRAGEPPLRVATASGGVRVSWAAEPGADAYRLYRGALPGRAGDGAAFGSGSVEPSGVGACTDGTAVLETGDGSSFYLVSAVAGDVAAGREGPLGFEADGRTERAGAFLGCPP